MDENIEDDKYNTRLGGEQTERNERSEDTAGRIEDTECRRGGRKGPSIQYLYLSGFPACLARLG